MHPNKKTSTDIVEGILAKVARKIEGQNDWGARHLLAWGIPDPSKGHEASVVNLIKAWSAIGDTVRADGRGVKDCYVLRPIYLGMARDIVRLLNFDCGRLDCGTVDRTVRAIVEHEGLNPDLEDFEDE